MKLHKFLTKGFCLWMFLGFVLFIFSEGAFTVLAGKHVQSIHVEALERNAEQLNFQGRMLTTTGSDSKLYFNRGKNMVINYIDISVKDLSVPTLNARLYYADTEDGFQENQYASFFIHEGFNEIKIAIGEKEYLRLHISDQENISMVLDEIVLRSAIRPLYRIPQGFVLFFLVWVMAYAAAAKMGVRYEKMQQSMIVLFEGMFAVFMLVVMLFSIGSIKYRLAVYVLIPLAAFVIAVIYPKIQIDKIKTRILTPVIFVCMAGMMCFVGYQMLMQMFSDLGTIYYSAWEIATDGRINPICTGEEIHTQFFRGSNNDYFLRYHNNLPIVAILSVYYKALYHFGLCAADLCSNYMSVLLNIVFILSAIVFGMLAVKNMYGKKGAFIYLSLSALFIPYYINACRFYTDTVSMPFVSLVLWMNTIKCKKFSSLYIKYFFIGIALSVGALIKGNIYIILLALCIQIVLKSKNNIRFVLMMLMVVCTVSVSWDIYTKNCSWVDMENNDDWEFPTVSFHVMMGLDRTVNGSYSQADLEYTAQYPTKSERQRANIEMIGYRIGSFGSLNDLYEYEFSKAAGTWCDGQYMQDIHITWSIEKGRLFDALITGRKYNHIYRIYTQVFSFCIYIFAVLGGLLRLKKPKADDAMFLRLTMLGAILFFMIWESKSRYLLNFTPVFMIAAIGGMEEIKTAIYGVIESVKE